MTSHNPKSEILRGPERRRRPTAAEKLALIAEARQPGMTVSRVARRHGIAPNQLFAWRRLAKEGALTATAAGKPVVPASAYKALAEQIRELQRRLGKKTMEAEILKEALHHAKGSKKHVLRSLLLRAIPLGSADGPGQYPMMAICETLGGARSNVLARIAGKPSKRMGRQLTSSVMSGDQTNLGNRFWVMCPG